ncbi:MAG: ribosomal-processing cysteine protease Prp [Acutalibacteraceae bacterium]
MIRISFSYSNGLISGFEIRGHSGFGEYGSDVVCAAVSSSAYMVVNTITDVLNSECEELVVNDGEMKLLLDAEDCIRCQDILKGLKLHFSQLSDQYSDYIKIIGGKTDA